MNEKKEFYRKENIIVIEITMKEISGFWNKTISISSFLILADYSFLAAWPQYASPSEEQQIQETYLLTKNKTVVFRIKIISLGIHSLGLYYMTRSRWVT